MKDPSLERLRKQMAAIDGKIVRLLGERTGLSREIGRIKLAHRLAIYDPVQEAKIHDDLAALNKGALPENALAAIYREILSASRALQAPVTVAGLGPEASFSHLAAQSHFGASAEVRLQKTIYQVFDAVERGKADWGIVPVENSLEGSVNLTLDGLISTPLRVRGEILLRINYCLLSAGRDMRGIRKVYSHPQALAQCQHWLRGNLPQADLVEVESTAAAAAIASTSPKSAAVGSRMAAEVYGLKRLAENIEDHPSNTTRFLIMGTGKGKRTGNDKTSIIFGTSHIPGALYQTLRPFAERGINLLKIASYPTKEGLRESSSSWEYLFFADAGGHEEDKRIRECLQELATLTKFLKILGAYPAGRGVL